MQLVYKICTSDEWEELRKTGRLRGSADDLRDGFVHLSGPATVRATAARHFAGRSGLVLVAVDAARLGPALRMEASRGGALFPHLCADLPLVAVVWAKPLPLAPDGTHGFPDEVPV